MAKGKKTGGRQPGSANRLTGALKDMILGALSDVGGQNYLAIQATTNPNAFLALVGRVLPLTVGVAGANGQAGGIRRVIFELDDTGNV